MAASGVASYVRLDRDKRDQMASDWILGVKPHVERDVAAGADRDNRKSDDVTSGLNRRSRLHTDDRSSQDNSVSNAVTQGQQSQPAQPAQQGNNSERPHRHPKRRP
ncbi:hypothetical protein AYO20_11660 [Fonsecaea nubica]|uniref:Uncharacterized protein n=1 Tax=Fonsecaea nubica TaxID=856822 RepID=A0A178BNM1_9EURO|nr:hypothetical protein AYO20_11660 [Fonsecaea nubica]OAL19248.1 hypothetical protein AYO20_11660 [Fonsecaea nubica]